MKELEIKSKILQDLIDQMDEKGLEGLKAKSPKFMKVEVESNDPELAEEVVEGVEPKMDEESEEQPEMSLESEEDELSDDDLERLKELYSKLK